MGNRVSAPTTIDFAKDISLSKKDKYGSKNDYVLQEEEFEREGVRVSQRVPKKKGEGSNLVSVTYEDLQDFSQNHGDGNRDVSTQEFLDFLDTRPECLIQLDNHDYLFRDGEFFPHVYARLVLADLEDGMQVTEGEASIIERAAISTTRASEFLRLLAQDPNISFSAFNQVMLSLEDYLIDRQGFEEAAGLLAEKLFGSIEIDGMNDYFAFLNNVELRLEWDVFLNELSPEEQAMVRSAAVDFINSKEEVSGVNQARLYMYYIMLTRSSDYFLQEAILTDAARAYSEAVADTIFSEKVLLGDSASHLEWVGRGFSDRNDSLLSERLGIDPGVVEERYTGSSLERQHAQISRVWERQSSSVEDRLPQFAHEYRTYGYQKKSGVGKEMLDETREKWVGTQRGLCRRLKPVWEKIPFLTEAYYDFAKDCLGGLDSSVIFRFSADEISAEAQEVLVDFALRTNISRTEARIIGSRAHEFPTADRGLLMEDALYSRTYMNCIELVMSSVAGFYGIDLNQVPARQQNPDNMNGLETAAFLRRGDGSAVFDYVLDSPVREGNGWLGYVSNEAVIELDFTDDVAMETSRGRAVIDALSPLAGELPVAAFVGIGEHYVPESNMYIGGHSFVVVHMEGHPNGDWQIWEANVVTRGAYYNIHYFTEEDLMGFLANYERFKFLPVVQGGPESDVSQLFDNLLVQDLSIQRPGSTNTVAEK